jgi:hypothetical protein
MSNGDARLLESDADDASWLNSKLGPFYDVDGVAAWLQLDESQVLAEIQECSMLGVQTQDGFWVLPIFQFDEDGERLPSLQKVLRILENGTQSHWTWALWLVARPESTGRRSAVEQLWAGETEQVIRAATHDVWSWSQ